ncbi:MAG: UDP-galactose-lipid carrier transferase [Actinobacteria bacterium]|nr:UDP-galactose-lipid carrier transferase [Actinomycetota bacterium]
MAALADADLSLKLDKSTSAERIAELQRRMLALRLQCGGLIGDGRLGPPVCAVFEGWDASGKGGAIRRLVAPLDPRHVRVASYAAPTPDERRHHFLSRFWPVLPGWGGMSVLDRSWYGRVLVERVEGFATPEQWTRAYHEITEFETMLAAEGMVIAKFWMHISAKEQEKRFAARAADPLKEWKLTGEDQRNAAKRPQYEEAIGEMLDRTDHAAAPWHVIAGESKHFARVAVLETTIRAIENGLRANGMEPVREEAEL